MIESARRAFHPDDRPDVPRPRTALPSTLSALLGVLLIGFSMAMGFVAANRHDWWDVGAWGFVTVLAVLVQVWRMGEK